LAPFLILSLASATERHNDHFQQDFSQDVEALAKLLSTTGDVSVDLTAAAAAATQLKVCMRIRSSQRLQHHIHQLYAYLETQT